MKSNVNNQINNFKKKGILKFNNVIQREKCINLYNQLIKGREWGPDIFRSQKDVILNPQYKKTNPGKGISNLAEKFDLDFIEKNETILNTLNFILGEDFEIILKKFVVAAPSFWIPGWLKDKIAVRLGTNLGPYIKEKFRDMSYFRGIDYHQDQIDFPNSEPDFVTMYVYLNDTISKSSPLHVIEKSHIYGPTKFPHFLKEVNDDYVIYGLNKNNFKKLKRKILIGNAGTAYIWSCLTLHGTKPQEDKNTIRISLRYLIKKNKKNKKKFIIDKLFPTDKKVLKTRDDIDFETHKVLKTRNDIDFGKLGQKKFKKNK